MSVIPNTQGSRIRAARLSAGLTQAQLARAVSTSERNIVRWENDQNAARFVHVAAIAVATGKDVSFFLVESGNGSAADDDEESDLMTDLYAVVRRIVREEVRSAA